MHHKVDAHRSLWIVWSEREIEPLIGQVDDIAMLVFASLVRISLLETLPFVLIVLATPVTACGHAGVINMLWQACAERH